MKILYLAATEMEIAPFLLKKPLADFLISGVGVPATIYHLVKRLQRIDYDLVIQAGIAGSFDNTLALGDVVVIEKDNFADIGISEQQDFSTIFEKGFAGENDFPFTKGRLVNTQVSTYSSYAKVNAVTVNTVTDSPAQIALLMRKFKPQVETMEGAALHYTCLNEHIPFLQLRSISNFVGERDKEKWKIREAIENLNDALLITTEKLLSLTHN